LDKIQPIDNKGQVLDSFPEDVKGIRFSDGENIYSYSKSKSVLLKKFDMANYKTLPPIALAIDQDIWKKISKSLIEVSIQEAILVTKTQDQVNQDFDKLVPGVNYVVLPLYGTRNSEKIVESASGINQWNAAGRPRKYGEAYIPIPAKVHQLAPGFFPERDQQFNLVLPNSKDSVPAKVCQQGSKALMSNPNDRLCRWLYRVIDSNFSDYDFDRPPNRQPFTYGDLEKVGRDSVIVIKNSASNNNQYEIRFASLGSYEEFLEEFSEA
jgi:hypothetical protein